MSHCHPQISTLRARYGTGHSIDKKTRLLFKHPRRPKGTDWTVAWQPFPVMWSPTLRCPSSLFLLVKFVALLPIPKASHFIVWDSNRNVWELWDVRLEPWFLGKWALLGRLFLTQQLCLTWGDSFNLYSVCGLQTRKDSGINKIWQPSFKNMSSPSALKWQSYWQYVALSPRSHRWGTMGQEELQGSCIRVAFENFANAYYEV